MSKATGFVKEFRDFAVKGNAVDLAVGVIIGAAFGRIVDSLVKDIVMPLVNFVLGGSVDFSNKFLVLSMPAGYNGPMTYADLTKAGANVFAWGNFVTIIINFVLLAFVIFWMVKAIYKARVKAEEAPAAPAATDDAPSMTFAVAPAAGGVRWVKPELIAEVSFGEWTGGGHIRHSVFRGLRQDKPVRAISREKAVPVKDIEGDAGATGGAGFRRWKMIFRLRRRSGRWCSADSRAV